MTPARQRLVIDGLILLVIVLPLVWIAVTRGRQNVPGRAMSLVGTSWRVVEIDGRSPATASSPTITFEDGVSVTVWTGCREGMTSYGLDTDGEALSFGRVELSPGVPCPQASQTGEAAFLEALLAIDEWDIENGNRITFIGPREITLERRSADQARRRSCPGHDDLIVAA